VSKKEGRKKLWGKRGKFKKSTKQWGRNIGTTQRIGRKDHVKEKVKPPKRKKKETGIAVGKSGGKKRTRAEAENALTILARKE